MMSKRDVISHYNYN